MRRLAVLRPEPGNSATARRIVAAGGVAMQLPLFAVRPLAWDCSDPAAHDALLLTSANAVRHAGAGLAALRSLPVYAVGAATAAAAERAGLSVVAVGEAGATALAERARAAGVRAALHLAGRDRAIATLAGVGRTVAVYASEPLPRTANDLAVLHGMTALLHSARAARRLATLVPARDAIKVAALSAEIAAAAGDGWRDVMVAPSPTDNALIARALAD